MFKKSLIYVFILFFGSTLLAQNTNEQFEFKLENDKLIFVDKYYTSGFFFTYRKDLQSNFIFKNNDNNKVQLNLSLGNETYTPTNLRSTNPADFDRPYAGWLFAKAEVGQIKSNSALFIGVESGITGEASLAGSIQTFAHRLFGIEEPTWEQEIEFKFLVNLKTRYILNKRLGKSHAFKNTTSASLGTKDIFISNHIEYTFGKFNKFNQSSRTDFLDANDNNEFFGFIAAGYKYVAHNTLIQGSLDYNDATFTTNREPNIFEFKVGSTLKVKRNTFKLIYNFNTKETPQSTSHAFGTLSFSRSF